MKYKYFFIVFLAVGVSLGHMAFVNAQVSESDSVGTTWSRRIPELGLISDFATTESDLSELVESEQRLSMTESILASSHDTAVKSLSETQSLLEKIHQLQSNLKKNIIRNENEIKNIEREIVTMDGAIKRLNSEQVSAAAFLQKSFVQSYKNEKLSQIDLKLYSLLFGNTFGEALYQNDSTTRIENTTKNLIERQKNLSEELIMLKKNKEKKIAQKKHITESLVSSRDNLIDLEQAEREIQEKNTTKKENISRVLAKVAQKKQTVQAKIQEQKIETKVRFEKKFAEYEASLKGRLNEFNCSVSKSPVCTWLEKYIASEKDLMENRTTVTRFTWPVQPHDGFGYHFRDQKYYMEHISTDEHHTGLDILTPAGVPVQAIADGYILMKQEPNQNSDGLVVIKHPGGYMSLYVGIVPHQREMFSWVFGGDIIGTTREYRGDSVQNNVHIEWYENNKLTDVIEKLDLSNIDANKIPARYGYKYLDDLTKAGKKFDASDLAKKIGFFYIAGDSEGERQKNLLSMYAANDFQDRSIWVKESISESVDPTFVICVGLAESSLGKNLTTEGNIGNVGNTDSGARRNYENTRSGIRAIGAVVNNTWLGGYATLDQLSGWGNPAGPIYASSRTNWHENVLKCMSALKGKYVGSKTNFRLSQAALLLYQKEGFISIKSS